VITNLPVAHLHRLAPHEVTFTTVRLGMSLSSTCFWISSGSVNCTGVTVQSSCPFATHRSRLAYEADRSYLHLHACRSSASIISFETVCIFVQMAYSLSKSKLPYSRCSEVVATAATVPRLQAIRSCAAPSMFKIRRAEERTRRVIRFTGAPTLHFRACANAYFCYECTGL
jgi:hypothetical protein